MKSNDKDEVIGMARSWTGAGIGIFTVMSLSFGIVQAAENAGGVSSTEIVLYEASRNNNSTNDIGSVQGSNENSAENHNDSSGTANASNSSTAAGTDPGHNSDNMLLKDSDSGDNKLPGQEKSTKGSWSSSTPDFDEELVQESGSDSGNDHKQDNILLKSSDNGEAENVVQDRGNEEKLSSASSSAAENQITDSGYNAETEIDRDNNMFFKPSIEGEKLQAQDGSNEERLDSGNNIGLNEINDEASDYDSNFDSNQDNMFFKPSSGLEEDRQDQDKYIEDRFDSGNYSASNESNDTGVNYDSKPKSDSGSDKMFFKYSNRGQRDFPGQGERDKNGKSRYEWIFNDDSYNYYVDRKSCKWVRLPYSASEYMIDVWVCLVSTGSDSIVDEYDNEGNIVGRQLKYYMEHYYIRPSTQQIQFLCELEVTGRPQNTISERDYRVKNWENLIPGSIEDEIYRAVVKRMGKKGSSSKGHMGFFDMVEEYGRISL